MLEIYQKMYLIRRMEESLAQYYLDNKIMSFVHFCVGQEAVAVGVCENLTLEDRVFGNHRSHGHYLAKGGCPDKMVAELLGKETGCSKGRGGSMHLVDQSVNFCGTTPILGSVVPIAVGSAMQQKLQREKGITVCFVGDGASEEGVFYESINLAALHKLPLMIVVEDNMYSVMSKYSARRSVDYDLKTIVKGLGANYESVDGNNVNEVLSIVKYGKETLSAKPLVIHAHTFRHMAHSAPLFDDNKGYRVVDNLEERGKFDSVKNLRKQIENEQELVKIEEEIEEIIRKSFSFAQKSHAPQPDRIKKYLFV